MLSTSPAAGRGCMRNTHTRQHKHKQMWREIWLCQPCTHASGLTMELSQHRFPSHIYIWYIVVSTVRQSHDWFLSSSEKATWRYLGLLALRLCCSLSSADREEGIWGNTAARDRKEYLKGQNHMIWGLWNPLLVTFFLTPFRLFGNPLSSMWWFTWRPSN